MKGVFSEEGRKEYDKFMNEQFELLTRHFSRIILNCYNKFWEIANRENDK